VCHSYKQHLQISVRFIKTLSPLRILFFVYYSTTLPVVLYGCEGGRGEELRLRLFENRLLRRIFGPKRDEVMGEWRKMHNEVLHDCTLRQV
jgi:hypothetical protein